MSTSDIVTLEKLRSRVGRPFHFEMDKGRCIALDLTSGDYIWSGLIRHHSQVEKEEILALVCQLEGLKKLNLRRNLLGRLPEAFRGLTQLEELNLGSNRLGIIPPQLAGLKRLKYLHLGNNYITTVPEFVSELQELEYFTLHKNIRIKSVENLAGLKRLKHLNLHYLNLHRLPPFIYEFRSLVTLTLWNVREIKDEIANLTNLEFFSDCGCPGLRTLPDSLLKLRRLRMIRLFQNNLESLPENFGDLENLEELSLYQNKLVRLPDSFAKLQKLKKLNLAWNRFRSVPACLTDCAALEWLAVFENPLKHGEQVALPPQTTVLKVWPFTTSIREERVK